MRQLGLSVAVGSFAIIAGCSAPDYSIGPQQRLQLPRSSVAFDCQLTEYECQIVRRGIDYLLGHANPMCRLTGSSALDRYNAPSGEGFRDRPQDSPYDDMSVYYTPPGGGAYPSDGYTNVYPSFWGGNYVDATTGALIAHEEYHHVGANEDMANDIQDQCLNPQP